MKEILLTGAKGFSGNHFSVAAINAGYLVKSLNSNLNDIASLNAEVSKVNPRYVVHLAALSNVNNLDLANYYHVNLFGTINLLEALSNLSEIPDKILIVSSANVYGNGNANLISEKEYPKPVNHYAMSKLAMEMLSLSYLEKLPLVLARPFNYTGRGQDERFVIPKIVNHFKRKASEIELGNINVFREFNDVRMVCDAYLGLLKSGIEGEIYNICTGRAISLNNIISILEKHTKHKLKININQSLIRSNEIEILRGSPRKLVKLIGKLNHYTHEDTLSWMLGK
jgi:nucleoside-diphosphate-sugar epimerase